MGSVVDYSYGRVGGRDSSHLDAVKAAGFGGIARYVSFDGWPKNLTKQEYDYALSIGLDVCVVWETTASMMLRGAQGGASDSYYANKQLDDIGFDGEDIFYAADFDVFQSHFGTMEAYLDATVGRRENIYGEYDVIEHFVGGGRVSLGWQCAAWSGSGSGTGGSIEGRRVSTHACLFQRVGYVLQNTCDTNDVLKPYWGQAGGNYVPGIPATPVENPDVLVIPTNPKNEADYLEAMMSGCITSVNDGPQFFLDGGSIHVVGTDGERDFRIITQANPRPVFGGDWLELKSDNDNAAVKNAIKFYDEKVKPRLESNDFTIF